MAEASRTLKLSILADVDNLKKGLNQASNETSSFGGKIGEFGKKAALAFAAVGIAAGVMAIKFAKDAIAAGEAAATANARIEQINTSMGLFGESTNTVTANLIKYAEETARATGIDTNSIKATQAKLLTFKELALSADTLGGNFERATAAAIDLGAAGFGTAETNAVALGKALNDPIKGITALTKSGITFTEAEKERIKTLVESNKMGEAQAMILKAIETQVGGTAEATANASDKMKVALTQITEKVGLALLPAFEELSNFILNVIFPVFQDLGDLFADDLLKAFDGIKLFVKDSLIPIFTDLWSYFTTNVLPLFKSYADLLSVTLLPAIKALWGFVQNYLIPIFKATLTPVITALTGVFKKLKEFVEENNGVFTFFGAVIGVIGTAAKFLAPIIGSTLGAAFKVVSLIIDGVSLAIAGVVAGINLAIAAINLLIKGYNVVNNLFGGKDLREIPAVILAKGAKATTVTPANAQSVKAEIAKEVGNVAKQVAKETAAITKTAAKSSAATASKVVAKELKDGLLKTTRKIDQSIFAMSDEAGFFPSMLPDSLAGKMDQSIFAMSDEAGSFPPPTVINVNVSGAIDQEGTARTIVNTLNNSFYRGTNGAGALVTA